MIKDYEIPLPAWKIDDPFGRAALRQMRFDMKRVMCERDAYRVELEETLKCQGKAVDRLTKALADEQARTKELERRLGVSEEARKSIGYKMSEQSKKMSKLKDELAMYQSKLELVEGDFDELQKEHERVIRGLTDKTVEVGDESAPEETCS